MALPDALPARLAVVAVALLSIAVVWWLDEASGEHRATLRSRFVLGVPWGTLLVICFVLAVYLVVQRGFDSPNAPLVLPFRAWSYLYPLGILTAPFSHASSGHLVGNLIGTLTFAPIAEYAWGHYRRSSTSPTSVASSVFARPFARIIAFVFGTLAIGLVTGLFALGPVIGFSGVVFAFAGFALVRYPLTTVIALTVGGVFQLLYSALSTPVTTASAQPSFASPWWAGIAIQGHALGLLCGVLLGALFVRRRDAAPPAGRLWLGVLIFSVSQSLWAVYWYRGGETFVLFRAVGTVLVFALATLVAVGVATPDRSLADTLALDRDGALDFGLGLSTRRLATMVLVAALLGMALPAVPVNLTAVADGSSPAADSTAFSTDSSPSGTANATDANRSSGPNASDSNLTGTRPNGVVAVRGYTIRYAEGVQDELVSVIDISAFGESTAVNTSGVIVTNPDREIWTTAVSKSRLEFAGTASVRVGGVGWEEVVHVRRTGWDVVGGNTTYKVFSRPPGENRRLAYAARPATATPVLDGKNVSIAPAPTGYAVVVSRTNETLGRASIPSKNGSATIAGLTFERRANRLVATYGESEVPIAKRETYRGE